MKVVNVCLFVLFVLDVSTCTAAAENIPAKRPGVDYLDPCKAEGFSGDVALTRDEFRTIKRMIIKQTANDSFFEIPPEDHSVVKRDTVGKERGADNVYIVGLGLEKELANLYFTAENLCEQTDVMQCRQSKMKWRNKLLNARIKSHRLKLQKRRMNIDINEAHNVEQRSPGIGVNKNTKEDKNINSDCEEGAQNCFISEQDVPKAKHSIHKRGAIANQEKQWKDAVIPYMIDDFFSSKAKVVFKLAMELWERHTCLVFKEREPDDKDYIIFIEGTCGCCSHVGRIGGAQGVSIGKGCDKVGVVTHELGHAIGFHHEHTRPDRNEYIKVIYENIKEKEKYNFDINKDINSLNESYDFDSIMHYSRSVFSNQPNLITLAPYRKPGVPLTPQIGQRVRPSEGDIRQVAKLYGCTQCGGTMLEPSGHFVHSPKLGVPDLCRWRISANHGERVDLTINDLDLPKANNCATDYLEVRDGYFYKSPLITRICSSHKHQILTSTGNQMWIEFKTSNGDSRGFTADYDTLCGGEIIKDEGTISSPNFPDDYPAIKECVWTITVADNFTVGLMFDMFELENHPRCIRDYVELRDGPSAESPLIGTYCGIRTPAGVTTTGRHLYMKFVSSKYIQKSGFLSQFVKERDECLTDNHGCEHDCVNTLGSYHCTCRFGFQLHSDGRRCETACGGYIKDEYGEITSPSFPDIYPAFSHCIWKISVPADHRIYLNFTHFDLEGHDNNCKFDHVNITDDFTETSSLFCGYILPSLYASSDNALTLEFRSDGTVEKSGFSLTIVVDTNECILDNGGCEQICKNTIGSYECECDVGFVLHSDMHNCKKEGCHEEIRESSGVFNSPNYPEQYLGREDCSWQLMTAPGHRISIEFVMFDLEPQQNCDYDHLTVYDGENNTAPSIGTFCGFILPEPITSKGNSLFVTFFSDASVQRSGFSIRHDVQCGAVLVASEESQFLVSHALYGEELYDINQDCQWLIRAPRNRLIQLTFTEFELESEPNCYFDVVFVYDGSQDTDSVLGKYCGLEIPDVVISSSNTLLVQFLSDYVNNRKGFSAAYKLISDSH